MKTQILAAFAALIASNAAFAENPKMTTDVASVDLQDRLSQCWSDWNSDERLQAEYDVMNALSAGGLFFARSSVQRYIYNATKPEGSYVPDSGALYTLKTCANSSSYYKLGNVWGKYMDLAIDWKSAKTSDFTIAELKKAEKTKRTLDGKVVFGTSVDCERQAKRFEAVLSGLDTIEFISSTCNAGESTTQFYTFTYDDLPISRTSYEAIQTLLTKKYEELENGQK